MPHSPRLHLHTLQPWLSAHLDDLPPKAQLQASLITGGQSNPTWLLQAGPRRWVLRAKPGKTRDLLPSAHAIEREVQVQRALAGQLPLPRIRVECHDEDIIGAAFYVMDHVEGRVLRDSTLADLPPAQRPDIHEQALQTLAQLHRIDPAAVGLDRFGRHEAYIERTLQRWSHQYQASRTGDIPAMDHLTNWLSRHIPPALGQGVSVVHGDYRLENLMFAPTTTQVVAVLDWELSTLGDPLSDLAYYGMAWHNPPGLLRGIAGIDLDAQQLPRESALIDRYCHHRGLDDPTPIMQHWPFYLALNFFRLTAILQGIAHRVAQGQTRHPAATELAALTPLVAETGWRMTQHRL